MCSSMVSKPLTMTLRMGMIAHRAGFEAIAGGVATGRRGLEP